jgi:hypothetical protein
MMRRPNLDEFRRALTLLAAVAMFAGVLAPRAHAGDTLDWPKDVREPFPVHSGDRSNPADIPGVVWQDVLHVPDADSMRIYFGEVMLPHGSAIRMTSLRDNETQVLDARAVAMWNNASAYFNGDTVIIELIAGPRTKHVMLSVDEVGTMREPESPLGQAGQCGICGPEDDRRPSFEEWTGRLLPAGCTADVYNEQSCMVSAGHCVDGSGQDIVQFNVPASSPNCGLNHPSIADQFPITAKIFRNGDIGDDWSALATGVNSLGETIYERYGEFRSIATEPPGVGQDVVMHGYGLDLDCLKTQTQQVAAGVVTSVFPTYIRHTIDLRNGTSGAAIMYNGKILGVGTHCPCPNFGTRVDVPDFAAARAAICTSPAVNDDCADRIPFNNGDGDGVVAFSTVGTGTDGPENPPGICNDFGNTQTYNDIWFTYSAQCTGDLTVTTCDDIHGAGAPLYDTDLVVYGPYADDAAINCAALTFLACNDDDPNNPCGSNPQGPFSSTITVTVKQGDVLLIRVGGWAVSDVGTGMLSVMCSGTSTGACCLFDGSCIDVSKEACSAMGGAWQSKGSVCAQTMCPPVTGACCTGSGCFVLTTTNCGFAGGVYLGPGVACSPDPCVAPIGACCLPGGECRDDLDEDDCIRDAGGEFVGESTFCSMTMCPNRSSCPTDCTPPGGNGIVNIDDLLETVNAFGSAGPCDCAPANPDGSFGNGLVNIDDLLMVINTFGPCPRP